MRTKIYQGLFRGRKNRILISFDILITKFNKLTLGQGVNTYGGWGQTVGEVILTGTSWLTNPKLLQDGSRYWSCNCQGLRCQTMKFLKLGTRQNISNQV